MHGFLVQVILSTNGIGAIATVTVSVEIVSPSGLSLPSLRESPSC